MMDRLGHFAEDQGPGFASFDAPSAHEADPTPPPAIGSDERRMHVRAYNFWANLLGSRSFPAIDDLDLDQLGDFGENAVLLDFTSGIENPSIGYLGDALVSECDLTPDTGYIADVPRKSLLSRLTDHYLQIIANRAPIGFEAEFLNARGATIMYRGVLLPFSSDDDTIDFILGVINWKEAASAEVQDALAQEVAAAAAVQPAARQSGVVMPLWADGPDSDSLHPANDSADGEAAVDDAADDADDDAAPAADYAQLPDLGEDADEDADDEAVDADVLILDTASASLADRLALARESAGQALQSEARGHKALYEAIGRAWDFARAIADAPADFAELVDEAGLTISPRSPMTAVAKLVFGAGHDKTRLAEITTVLRHAEREALDPAELTRRIASHAGGLKGLVKAERAASRPATATRPDKAAIACQQLRQAAPLARIVGLPQDDSEFVVLVARRDADGLASVVARLSPEHAAQVIAKIA
jgi:hypothetical protein